jgi:ammonium transporter, Amt family
VFNLVGCSLALGPDASSWLPRPFIGDFNNLMFHDVSFSRPYQELHISQGTYGHFQMMFACIAPLLMTGAYAERLSFKAFLLFSALWSFFVYVQPRAPPQLHARSRACRSYYPVAHWLWGLDGWLYHLGAQDFAGGIVIHVTSATSGLIVCRALGPRRGFDPLGEPFPHSNLVLSAIGLGMLWVGWFGFNAGSAFAAGAQASEAIMNTHASACCSALAWLYLSQRGSEKDSKLSFIVVANGSVAGLAAITPAAGASAASLHRFRPRLCPFFSDARVQGTSASAAP